jgi:hypothetical protein
MIRPLIIGCSLAVAVLSGCGAEPPIKVRPVERLDEQSALTIAVLESPITFIATGAQVFAKKVSMAYAGPVEWDRAGNISYSLWLELAPTDDQHFKDITEPKSVTFLLDDGPLNLRIGEAPKMGQQPYQSAASWGQIVYFDLSMDDLKRLAATKTLRIRMRRIGGIDVDFEPNGETQTVLTAYLNGRLVTGD